MYKVWERKGYAELRSQACLMVAAKSGQLLLSHTMSLRVYENKYSALKLFFLLLFFEWGTQYVSTVIYII